MPNRLIHENSPYLRQHAENPVNWYSWCDEAFHRASIEDKPIHLSVGYAACHWCHVMAHESFENLEMAKLMNERFINIKVDRQERPDIDEIYQKVVQMMGEGGGWPLTVFMTPKGEPFFGGTYFPPQDRFGRPGFRNLLLELDNAWKNHRPKLQQNVEQFLKGYQGLEERFLKVEIPTDEDDMPAKAARLFAEYTDAVSGGFSGSPKFPNAICYDLLLRIHHRTREPAMLRAFELTLDSMATGGIYDHLGGGFARYSTDERWIVPHFEKMLYDNGQLVKLYADAYRVINKPSWRRIFEQTIAYVLRDLSHPEGGFYASEDADSEGEEGKFYLWKPVEVKAILGESDAAFACRAFGITDAGNFEQGTTVLHRAVELNSSEETYLETLREKLLKTRTKRVRPAHDESILTSWNGLMIQGLCAAYQATGNPTFLNAAKRAADFIQKKLSTPEGGVYRVWNNGKAKIAGFLEDYSILANALLDLYESCFDPHYFNRAIQLVELILEKFWDNGLYFTSRDSERLIHRPKAPYDTAWPSGISTSAFVFLRLYQLTGHDHYSERAQQIFKRYGTAAVKNPVGFAHLLAAQDFAQSNPFEIIFAGDRSNTTGLLESIHRVYLPTRVLAFATDVPIGQNKTPINNQPTVYVCQNRTCKTPVTSADALLEKIKSI